MKKEPKPPFRIALFGMDIRTAKTLELYLKGPCRGIAVVVGEAEAEIDMIDADHYQARDLLEARRAAAPDRPIILLSFESLRLDNTFFMKKPINVERMEEVLAKIAAAKASARPAPPPDPVPAAPPVETAVLPPPVPVTAPAAVNDYRKKTAGVKHIDEVEAAKSAKHESARQLNEGGFTSFLGTLSNIDFNDKEQLATACHDPRQYFLAYVQAAYKTAELENKPLLLKTLWKPLYIFPEAQEIWLDADDKQLRAFAGITLNQDRSKLSLTAADPGVTADLRLDKFQDMQAFLWKLALWTSKGRFPIRLDIYHPVFMDRWPNFPRLIITPDALRIAALLVKTPTPPIEIPELLNIKPQYVFVFVSACHALGYLRECERQADSVIGPAPARKTKIAGLLGKILGKLRGG